MQSGMIRTRRETGERGVAILEFALIFPVLVALTFFVLEIAQYLRVAQSATVLARTAANTAFRFCADIPFDGDLPRFQSDTRTCLQAHVTTGSGSMAQILAGHFPNEGQVEMVVSVYRRGVGSDPEIVTESLHGRATRFTYTAAPQPLIANDRGVAFPPGTFGMRERAVSVEVYYPYRTWVYAIPFLSHVVFQNVIHDSEYYAAALL